MFVSREKGVSKKNFQKPNILRRKVKVSAPQLVTEANKSSVRLVSSTFVQEIEATSHVEDSKNPSGDSEIIVESDPNIGAELRPQTHITISLIGNSIQINNNEDRFVLNKPTSEVTQINANSVDIGKTAIGESTKCSSKCKQWLAQEVDDEQIVLYESSKNSEQNDRLFMSPKHLVGQPPESVSLLEPVVSNSPENKTLLLPQRTANGKLKCDAPNCKKEFKSEHRYRRHKDLHSTEQIRPMLTTVCIERLVGTDDALNGCGRVFLVRDKVLKHFPSEGDKDAECSEYKCEVCGRPLYWASDVIEKSLTLSAGGKRVFVCRWPECGRVFRQPCRLREHARAHTGDRPYACHYPDCKWSFRSASKLQRHRRRHTDDRRHACGTCGRAFLRRDHLREHQARHLPPRTHACTHPGCKQTFTNMSTLYMHMKKVHRSEEKNTTTPAIPEASTDQQPDHSSDEFMENIKREESLDITLLDVASLEANCVVAAEMAKDAEEVGRTDREDKEDGRREREILLESSGWQAARTHCTWPLQRQLIDDSIHVEPSECSESNNYTVKSDLFLHGNVLANEDSNSMCGVRSGECVEETNDDNTGLSLDNELGLLDSHPTIDLMQEELLLTNSLDESSFRVFLYSGEETS